MKSRRKLVLAAALTSVLLLGLVVGAAGALPANYARATAPNGGASSTPAALLPGTTVTPHCQPAWQLVDTPNGTPIPQAFGGVVAISANDGWAVGSYYSSGALTEHWDGGQWGFVSNPSAPDDVLAAAAALSPSDVWAVGIHTQKNTTLTAHWDGQIWSIVPSPSIGGNDRLMSVAAISANNIWAVGSAGVLSGTFSADQTLVEHWDGSVWSIIPSANINPPTRIRPNSLFAVSGTSANDIWAVGDYAEDGGAVWSLIEHWDGSSWQIVPAPNLGTGDQLWAVAAIAPDDAWAVGDYGTGSAALLLALHWDGQSWQAADLSYPGDMTNGLRGIVALASNDVWAVGDAYYRGGQPNRTLVEHWDGISWQVVASPSDSGDDTLSAISAASSRDIWAVGDRVFAPPPHTIALHYSCPPPTPTASPTLTPPPSATPSPSLTATPMPTTLPSSTATATTTPPSSPTLLPTVTPPPGATPSATVTPTPPVATATPCGQGYPDVPVEYWAYGYIRYLSCQGIISGYPDGSFRPNTNISRAEFSKMLALGYGLALSTPAQPSFADVPASYWAYPYIEALHAMGVISGYADGRFHPNASISRAELVKMDVLASGVAAYTGAQADYPDVPPGYWAYGYIKTATHQQWVGGYPDGSFRPASNASRAELSKLLFLSLSYPRQ